MRIKFNLQRLPVQLSHHITGGTARRKRVVRQDRAQEAMTGVIGFLKGLRVFSAAPKGTPGTKGQSHEETGNTFLFSTKNILNQAERWKE